MDNFFIRHKNEKTATKPYCDCTFPNYIQVITSRGSSVHQYCKCRCFDDENHAREWSWDSESADSETYIDEGKLTFHPEYSQGTQIIRGKKRLEPLMIHYWEIQIVTNLTGTDEMFGIGTDRVNLNKHQYEFMSALGEDEHSWAFSYRGLKQHNGILEEYGKKITQGCVIGVYLDLFHGRLEFYLNRQSLGIAYDNIPIDPTISLYPMVCSTASRSAIRLINATSQPATLEFQTMRLIAKRHHLVEQLKEMPGMKRLIDNFWFLIPPAPRYSYRSKKNELPIDDEVVLSKRSKKIPFEDEEFEVNDINDIYANVKIPNKDPDDDICLDDYRFYLF